MHARASKAPLHLVTNPTAGISIYIYMTFWVLNSNDFGNNVGVRAHEAWLALRGKFLLKCHQGAQFF